MGATTEDAEYWRGKIMQFYGDVRKKRIVGVDILLLHHDRVGTLGKARVSK